MITHEMTEMEQLFIEQEEYSEVVARLTEYANKGIITLPVSYVGHDGVFQMALYDMEDMEDREFNLWMKQVAPHLVDILIKLKKDEKDTYQYRKDCFDYIVMVNKQNNNKWPILWDKKVM